MSDNKETDRETVSVVKKKSRRRTWFEKQGLQFGDNVLEWEYLYTANYGRGIRATGAGICFAAAAFYSFTLYLDIVDSIVNPSVDIICVTTSVGVLTFSTLTCGLLLAFSFLAGGKKGAALLSQGAAYLFVITMFCFVSYAMCDSNFNAYRMRLVIDQFLSNYTRDWTTTCETVSLSTLNLTQDDFDLKNGSYRCGNYIGTDQGRCTVFNTLSVFTRLYGFVFESFMMRLCLCWVALQGIVVMNFLPARVMFFGIPFGVFVLLAIAGQFPLPTTLSNFGNSVVAALVCNKHLVVTIVAFFFEVFISVIAASLSLLLLVVARSRLKRELFFWTKKLDVSFF